MVVASNFFLLDGFGAADGAASAWFGVGWPGLAKRGKRGDGPGFWNIPLLSNGKAPVFNFGTGHARRLNYKG